jgi:NitT/TauT family transport system permease protein
MVNNENNSTELGQLSAGLDALETNSQRKDPLYTKVLRNLGPLLALAIFLAIWQLLILLKVAEDYVLPAPIDVFHALQNQWEQGALLPAAWNSLRRGVQGFALAIAIGTPLGLLLGLNKGLRLVLKPIITGLQQLPSVAWVPAAIIWFGLSSKTIYAVILLGAVPSIASGLSSGIDQIPQQFIKVGKVLGANRWQTIRHIILPAAFPGFLSGLEQGWAFAWRSLMAAELIAISPALGTGLGQLLDAGRQLGDMSLVLGAIISIMLVGIFVEKVFFSPVRERTLRVRGLK